MILSELIDIRRTNCDNCKEETVVLRISESGDDGNYGWFCLDCLYAYFKQYDENIENHLIECQMHAGYLYAQCAEILEQQLPFDNALYSELLYHHTQFAWDSDFPSSPEYDWFGAFRIEWWQSQNAPAIRVRQGVARL